jgi:hypothetical protein
LTYKERPRCRQRIQVLGLRLAGLSPSTHPAITPKPVPWIFSFADPHGHTANDPSVASVVASR